MEAKQTNKLWTIAIHGGAGVISKGLEQALKESLYEALREALSIGQNILKDGGSSTDAVESVIRYLEDCELFNAGKGSVFTRDGTHEMDASIMEGSTLQCGAVSSVKSVKNPISLARCVMTKTEHVHLTGEGAERFAVEMGVDRRPPEYFYTEKRYQQWQTAQRQHTVTLDHVEEKPKTFHNDSMSDHPDPQAQVKGTVGCVALDIHGNLCAGTSTGGMTNKKVGRVGDTPIIGAGTYANRLVAVSATGHGEEFIRHCVSHNVAAIMEYSNKSLQEAADMVIHSKMKPGDGGIIAVDKEGNIALVFNSSGMFRGCASSMGTFDVKIWEDE